jgi:TRAP transporter TAXI family solute receptor
MRTFFARLSVEGLCLLLASALLAFALPAVAQVPPPDLTLKHQQPAEPAPGDEAEPAAPDAAEPAAPAPPRVIVIGSAPVAGTFFPAAGALCREINRLQEVNGLRCLVEETEGSQENLQRLAEGTLDLAVVQSDWVYHAVAGSAEGLPGAFEALRALVLLQPQVFTLVAGAQSGVLGLADLPGKRVAIGPAGTGLNALSRSLLQHLGLESVVTVELPVEAQVAALCAGEVDGFLLPVAHPNGAVAEAIDQCGALLIAIEGEAVDQLVVSWPFYAKAAVPGGAYHALGEPVSSFGLVTTLVATSALSEDDAYAILSALFDQLDDFRLQHPTLQGLTPQSMSGAGFSAPLHPAAERFYQDRGLR